MVGYIERWRAESVKESMYVVDHIEEFNLRALDMVETGGPAGPRVTMAADDEFLLPPDEGWDKTPEEGLC